MSRVDFRAQLGWFEVPFGRSFGSFLLPFSAMCGPKVAPKTHPMSPGVPRVPPKCSKWPQEPPKWSIWVDFGAPGLHFDHIWGIQIIFFSNTSGVTSTRRQYVYARGEQGRRAKIVDECDGENSRQIYLTKLLGKTFCQLLPAVLALRLFFHACRCISTGAR